MLLKLQAKDNMNSIMFRSKLKNATLPPRIVVNNLYSFLLRVYIDRKRRQVPFFTGAPLFYSDGGGQSKASLACFHAFRVMPLGV